MNNEELNYEEMQVYETLKGYLKNNSLLSKSDAIDYVYQHLKANSNINKNKIFLILQSLVKKGKIIIGTKLIKDNILDVPLRKNIFDNIRKNPGININELENLLNIGSNQVLLHLDNLERFKFIKSIRIGNQKAYYMFDLDPTCFETYFYLRKEKIKRIIGLLKNSNAQSGLSPTRMSKQLNMHYNTIRKYLNILTEIGIIKLFAGNNQKRYFLDHKKYNEKLDVIKNYSKQIRSNIVQEFVLAF